ncbi:MAG: hypothetical protein ACLGHN_14595 [Bacteriovoracia bacterium]
MKSFCLFLMCVFSSVVFAESSPKCPGEDGYFFTNYKRRNPTVGGFVSNTAFVNDVHDELYIAPTAAVCGFASIEGKAGIRGNTLVRGNSVITDNAIVQGNIIVEGDSVISGKARILGNGIIRSEIIHDEQKVLTDSNPFEVTTPVGSDPLSIFMDLRDYVLQNAHTFVPEGGRYSHYREGAYVKGQTLSFVNDPCKVKITLARNFLREDLYCQKTSRGKIEAELDLRKFNSKGLKVHMHINSPTFTIPQINTLDGDFVTVRSWNFTSSCTNDLDSNGWKSHKFYSFPIEAPSIEVGENITKKLSNLVKACTKDN